MHRFGLFAVVAFVSACSSSGAAEDPENGGAGDAANGGSGDAANGARGPRGGRAGTPGTSRGGTGGAGLAGELASGAGKNGGKGGKGGTSSVSAGATGTSGKAGGSAAAPGNHTNPLSQDLIDAFVKAHNEARAQNLTPTPSPALLPVSWDAVLADSAYDYLSKCESSDGSLVDHNANRTKDYATLGGSDYVGENIFASSASSVMPADAVDSWMSEAPKYVQGDVANAGHYTQVVWRDSVRIGCAIVNCPSVRFHNTVLCDYAPGGNISGQSPY